MSRSDLSETMGEALRVAGERLTWSDGALARYRLQRLRATIAHARAASPFYAERLARVDPETFRESDLADVPPTTKQDLMEHFDRIVTRPGLAREQCEAHATALTEPAPLDGARVFATSGSTGRRAIAIVGEDEWLRNHATLLLLYFGQRRRERADATGVSVGFGGASPAHMSAATAALLRALDPSRAVETIPAAAPFGDVVARIAALRPSVLNGFGSLIARLARAQLRGQLDVAPQLVVSIGEPLAEHDRASIDRAWGCPIHSAYGCSELGWLAATTGDGGAMLCLDDQFVMEPVDAAGRRVEHGVESSAVLFTTLDRTLFPLIRYELADRVSTLPPDRSSAIPFTRIESVLGRNDDWFRWGDVEVHPTTFRSELIEHPAIDEFQVHQTPRGAVVFAVLQDRSADLSPVVSRLRAALAAHGVRDPEVEIRAVAALDRPGQGQKLRVFVPLGAAAGATDPNGR